MENLTDIRRWECTDPRQRVGATYVPGEGVAVRLWAPRAQEAAVEWNSGTVIPLQRDEDGYFTGWFPDVRPGARYYFYLDGRRIPDPASRYQPDGVTGPSQVVGQDFGWTDDIWRGIPLNEWIIYEIHVGAYSSRHDFQGVIDDLPRLKALGVTTIEIMPVSQFPGARNWGYDGVFPHAVHNTYGTPEALKSLVNACHAQGLAVILDVVYNHLGPEGNVLYGCGHYTQSIYQTPWGDALNYDGPDSDHVRRYFLQTVWQWLTEYRFDGLRLDAVHMIIDMSAIPFLQEVSALKAEAERVMGRTFVLCAESDRNDSRLLAPREANGLGFDVQWADDFHHALHAMLTGEKRGYYSDYGGVSQLAKIYERGVAFEGEHSPFRNRRQGRPYDGIDRRRLIAEIQNHDQIGNRPCGDRLSAILDPPRLKLAAACVLLSPFMPLIFMGEEWGCRKPFLYFASPSDPDLAQKLLEGRRKEWECFGWEDDAPDPNAPETFEMSVLDTRQPDGPEQEEMLALYKRLIPLSRAIRTCKSSHVTGHEKEKYIALEYGLPDADLMVFLSFNPEPAGAALPEGQWKPVLVTNGAETDKAFEDEFPLPPYSAAILRCEKP